MGGSISMLYTYLKQIVDNVKHLVVDRKRKRDNSDTEEEINKVLDLVMHTPKRIKLVTTAKYIYQALFQEGKNSDVTIEALGHQFNLHKVYLYHSPYFASMFGGSWLEANNNYIIDIIDPSITVESLKIVFGSLYNDEITLNPEEIVSILASANMLQLDSIIEKCREVMIETINPKTVMDYYNTACQYGDKILHDTCMDWFLINLMTFYYYGPRCHLRTIPIPLMAKLVANPDLFVAPREFALYEMLKFWMYMHVHPRLSANPADKDINLYYSSRTDENPFLLTKEGEKFILAFESLRVHNLISYHGDVAAIQRDNIIPHSWLNSVVLKQWKTMLKVNQNEDKGPCSEIKDELFLSKSLRCGMILNEEDGHWRRSCFHYGMDLRMIIDGSTLYVTRNDSPECEQLLSCQTIRRLAIRVSVATLSEQRQVLFRQTTEIKNFTLSKAEVMPLLSFDEDVGTFPLIVSANILFTSPEEAPSSEPVLQSVQ